MALLARTLERVARGGGRRHHLERSWYLLLRTMARIGPAPVSALARALGLDPSTVTRQLAAMVADGLVVRRTDDRDRRSTIIALSDHGRRRMEATRRQRCRTLEELLRDWTPAEQHVLGALLGKLNRTIGDSGGAGMAR